MANKRTRNLTEAADFDAASFRVAVDPPPGDAPNETQSLTAAAFFQKTAGFGSALNETLQEFEIGGVGSGLFFGRNADPVAPILQFGAPGAFIGFHGATPISKPSVGGSFNTPEDVLRNLVGALALYGLIIDSTSD